MVASDAGWAVLACVCLANGEVEFKSAFVFTSEAERLQPLKTQQNPGMQLLLKILQERKMQANGAVERDRGLADGMTEREDERPPPGRLTAPVTVSCRATFLVFLIHQRVDVGLLWCFQDGTPGSKPIPSSRLERSFRPLCPAGSRGP